MLSKVQAVFFSLLFCISLPLSVLKAQGNDAESEGALLGLPIGVSITPGGTLAESDLLIKSSGPQVLPPTPWAPNVTLPDYRASAFMPTVGAPPDIDAFSVGFDWILANARGEVSVPPGHWGGVSFSVSRATKGKAGEPIEIETKRPDGAAADLFSYILPGSALPPNLVDQTERMQDSTEMNIAVPIGSGDLDGHDLFLSLFYSENASVLGRLPAALLTPKIYFSVSKATIARVPLAWWRGGTPSGAVVFEATWSATKKTWSVPKPFLSPSDFALPASGEVDAIAVDRVSRFVLFSSTDPNQDPIMFLDTGTDFGVPVKYTNKGGQSVSARIGLIRGDDVDAICALDRGGDPKMQTVMGSPRGFWPQTELDAQVYRASHPSGDSLHSWVTGWPGPAVRQSGLVICNLGILIPQPPWVTITQQPRNVTALFGGDPMECVVPIPPTVSGSGLPVFFTWGVIDQSFMNWDVSHQIEIRL